jgi:tRNA(Leu) C34 or U34 (ribose-2'-O)-methylase TrmL
MDLTYDSIKKETASAKLLVFGDDNMWIPNTLIESIDDSVVTLPQWFAEENGLEIYEL